jgi:uncharacterized protein YyaL (SSP411 family)
VARVLTRNLLGSAAQTAASTHFAISRQSLPMVDGKSAAYVCENFACKAPVIDPKQLGELLSLGSGD